MFGFFSRRKAAKSRTKLANQIQDVASMAPEVGHRKQLLIMRDKFLRQTSRPKNWKTIDGELNNFLNELANHVSKGNTNTVRVYIDYINKLIDARAGRDEYIKNSKEETLLGLKIQLHEKIDETGRLIQVNSGIADKLERLSPADPNRLVLEADKKTCESSYQDATVKIKHLLTQITEISTRLTPDDISFYKKLRELQGVPEELENETAEYLFHQEKFSTTAEVNRAIIDSRHVDAEPMPIPRHAERSQPKQITDGAQPQKTVDKQKQLESEL